MFADAVASGIQTPEGGIDLLTGPSTQSSGGDAQDLSLYAPVGSVDVSGVAEANQADFYATQNLAEPSGWKAFPDPCAVSSGYSVDAFVAPNTTILYTLCSGGAAAGSVAKEVLKTENAISTVVGTPPPGGDPEGLAAAGTLVVSAASGASFLYRSTDGGVSWTRPKPTTTGGSVSTTSGSPPPPRDS